MLRERRPHSFSRQVCLRLAARVRSGVNRVGLTPCRALPVLLCEQTSAVSVGMSQTYPQPDVTSGGSESNWRVRASACPGVTVAGVQNRLRILPLGEGD